MSFAVILLVAVSLSMDAFSLALVYGTLGLDRKSIFTLSITVGLFHFFMPILGMLFGRLVLFDSRIIVAIILCFIGINMCVESFKSIEAKQLNGFISFLSFGLAVSLDSFSVGIGIVERPILCALIFALSSYFFTLSGLLLGRKINLWFGHISTLIGGIVLTVIAIFYLLG